MHDETRARRFRILLMSGQPAVERRFLEALRRQPYDVRRAQTADRAVDMIGEDRPDLILTDLEMRDRRGPDLCRQLRRVTDALILAVASHGSNCVEALRAGADEFVTSSIECDELLARVDALLRRITVRHEEAVEVGDIRIDLSTRDVTVAGRRIRLRPKEFELLVHLLHEPEKVHTHRALLLSIWGASVQLRPHYVRMCIAHLRRMIEPDPECPRYIVTERAVGYRLRPFADRCVA